LRRAWKPVAQEVYFTEGSFDPRVRWNDGKTLVIGFPEGERPSICERSYYGVAIVCQAAPKKDFYPMEQSP
jgi:hypothetical protein